MNKKQLDFPGENRFLVTSELLYELFVHPSVFPLLHWMAFPQERRGFPGLKMSDFAWGLKTFYQNCFCFPERISDGVWSHSEILG